MTTFEELPAVCGLSRERSGEHAIGSTSRFGALDLDLRLQTWRAQPTHPPAGPVGAETCCLGGFVSAEID